MDYEKKESQPLNMSKEEAKEVILDRRANLKRRRSNLSEESSATQSSGNLSENQAFSSKKDTKKWNPRKSKNDAYSSSRAIWLSFIGEYTNLIELV